MRFWTNRLMLLLALMMVFIGVLPASGQSGQGIWYAGTHPGQTWTALKSDYSGRWNNGLRGQGSIFGEGLLTIATLGAGFADDAGTVGRIGNLTRKLDAALPDEVVPKSRFFHSTSDAAVDPIMKGGFRTDIPNPQAAFHNNRFGRGVYLSDSPAAALAERPGGVILNVDASLGRNLNIVNRGSILDAKMGKAIGRGARKHGFDSITTMSVQPNGGINTIIFDPANVRATGILP